MRIHITNVDILYLRLETFADMKCITSECCCNAEQNMADELPASIGNGKIVFLPGTGHSDIWNWIGDI